jgi:Tfp pilus assembly protein PilN
MKSLSELAAIYESWAAANEATAEQILASVDYVVDEVQEQRERAGQLKAEAAALKKRAAELRRLEQRRSAYPVTPQPLR